MNDLTLEMKKKKGGIAALLNLVFPGAGYVYCKMYLRGLIFFMLFPTAFLVLFSSGEMGAVGIFLLPVVFGGLVLCGLIDGFLAAERHNKKLLKAALKTMRKCPYCAEMIQAEAKICKSCQRDVAEETPLKQAA